MPMQKENTFIDCIGCGAKVADIEGPNFRYPNASVPGCWKVFGEIMAKEFGEFRYPAIHRLSVDAYAAQHPGTETRQTIQSVNVHLIALCLFIERKYPAPKVTDMMRGAVHMFEKELCWLEPPEKRGKFTVLDVIEAKYLQEHVERVQLWALSVWGAWSAHYNIIRSYCDRLESNRS
jgi:hypothetical protein